MSIVVSHQPDLAVTSEIAYQSGKGQYNQWLAQFQQQQENAKTQALMGGFSAGGKLGLGIAGMQQRERMQAATLAANTAATTAKSVAKLEDDARFSKAMGDRLMDARAMQDPLNPTDWPDVLKYPREQQEKLLQWADDVTKSRMNYKARSNPGTVRARVGGEAADQQAFSAGKDAYSTARHSINSEFRKGNIKPQLRDRLLRTVERNKRFFGNSAKRPPTPDEVLEGQKTSMDLPGGGESVGVVGPDNKYNELYQTPTKQAREKARTDRLVAGAAGVSAINTSLASIYSQMEDEPANEKTGFAGSKVDPATKARLQAEADGLIKIRDSLVRTSTALDTGFIEDLPLITQSYMKRIAENPNFENDSQKEFILMKQRTQPHKYVLDDPKYMHFRMGKAPNPANRWDHGGADPISTISDRGRREGRTYWENEGTGEFGDERPVRPPDPPPPPMPQDISNEAPPPQKGMGQQPIRGELMDLQRQGDAGVDAAAKFQSDTKLFEESAAARSKAVQQALEPHVRISNRKKVKRESGDPRRQGRSKKLQSTGEVEALFPRPENLGKLGAGYEIQFDRLYNAFPTLKHRTHVRFIQSMLRKYGYDRDTMRAEAPAHEQAAWNDAMETVKQLNDSMKSR